MNYDQPRQIESGPNGGKWHYTSRNDGRIYPIGYCSRYADCPACGGYSFTSVNPCATCDSTGVVELAPADRCPGHDTADEARAHYRAYLFDKRLRLDGEMSDQQKKCVVCDAWTTGYATLDHTWLEVLCDKHRTRAVMENLIPEIGDSIHS